MKLYSAAPSFAHCRCGSGNQRRRRRMTVSLRGKTCVCHSFTPPQSVSQSVSHRGGKESTVARNANTFTAAGAVRTTLWSLPGRQTLRSYYASFDIFTFGEVRLSTLINRLVNRNYKFQYVYGWQNKRSHVYEEGHRKPDELFSLVKIEYISYKTIAHCPHMALLTWNLE